MKTNTIESIKVLVLAILILVGVGSAHAWSGQPTPIAPGLNRPAPIRADANDQVKTGPLGVRFFSSNGQYNVFSTSTIASVPSNLVLLVKGKLGAVEFCNDLGASCRLASTAGGDGPRGPQGNGPVPSGGVLAFNRTECPDGWSVATNAQGRYVVGLISGGTLNGTVGTPMDDGDNIATGAHNHTYTYWKSVRTSVATGNDSLPVNQMALVTNGVTEGVVGAKAGTNAPYVQLLYCVKD